jgi:tetratricopeptide (TPR) repeat protein
VTFDAALAAARGADQDIALLSELARTALAEGREDDLLPILAASAEKQQSALLWQWRGLLERSIDEHESALASFAKAVMLAPGDARIAHGHARVALEAGIPASDLFRHALQLAPGDGGVLLGYVAALVAEGQMGQAETLLERAVLGSPLWIEGQTQLAHLRAISGRRSEALAVLESSIRQSPNEESLWGALLRLLVDSEEFEALDEALRRAAPYQAPGGLLLRYEAIAAAELGDGSRAEGLFAQIRPDAGDPLAIYRIRHLLRGGRLSEAGDAVEAVLKTGQAANAWPYADIVWRLSGDRRAEWLNGAGDPLFAIIDLTDDLPDLGVLEQTLRRLHVARGSYLDQSVRGGVQTDGPLLTNIDPVIRKLRSALVSAIERFVDKLPAAVVGHPLLGRERGRRIRFAGSWSVLLRKEGYHANHVHPQGWISSALYVRVPDRSPEDPTTAGWLTLGEPQARLGIGLPPVGQVEPRPGRLVLFPSYMWHGTRPFGAGERLSVAFDVKPPS